MRHLDQSTWSGLIPDLAWKTHGKLLFVIVTPLEGHPVFYWVTLLVMITGVRDVITFAYEFTSVRIENVDTHLIYFTEIYHDMSISFAY